LKYVESEAGTSFDPAVVKGAGWKPPPAPPPREEINRSHETSAAPDKRLLTKGTDRLTRDTNLLRTSIVDSIHSAQRELFALYEVAQEAPPAASISTRRWVHRRQDRASSSITVASCCTCTMRIDGSWRPATSTACIRSASGTTPSPWGRG